MLDCQKGQREQALDICKPYCQFQDKLMPPLFGEEAGIKTPPVKLTSTHKNTMLLMSRYKKDYVNVQYAVTQRRRPVRGGD